MYVAVTDDQWYEFLAAQKPDEVNFWRPRGKQAFHAVGTGELFLFKLHSPNNFIAGGGFFVRHTFLPLSLAWECFREKNGAPSLDQVRTLIRKFREKDEANPVIGCTILAEPFFFPQDQWIPIPKDWAPNVVSGKTYDTSKEVGLRLFNAVQERLQFKSLDGLSLAEAAPPYGQKYLQNARIGQGAFRVLVTDAYTRRCSITGERTLPVLEAAHIRPYADRGPNLVSNGLLLRSDLHLLFDRGYLTVTQEHRVEVSRRIREEFENGRDYYALHGKPLKVVPDQTDEQPDREFLSWHNTKIYA